MGYNISKNEKIKFENKLYIYEAALDVLKAKISLINNEYSRLAKTAGLSEIQKITSRIKSIDSIACKLEKNNLEFNEKNIKDKVHDVVGTRIVCLTLNDVEALVNLTDAVLCKTEGFKIINRKDYIKTPKPSGYQSFHFQLEVPVTFAEEKCKVNAEIQIRTMLMDAWSTLEHKLKYKNNEEEDELILNQFVAIANMINTTDRMIATRNKQKQKRK